MRAFSFSTFALNVSMRSAMGESGTAAIGCSLSCGGTGERNWISARPKPLARTRYRSVSG